MKIAQRIFSTVISLSFLLLLLFSDHPIMAQDCYENTRSCDASKPCCNFPDWKCEGGYCKQGGTMCGKHPLPCCSSPNPQCIPSESCNSGYCGNPPTATPSCGMPFKNCCSTEPKCVSPYNRSVMICQGNSCVPETTICGGVGQQCCSTEPKCHATGVVCGSNGFCNSPTSIPPPSHQSTGSIDFNALLNAIPSLNPAFKGGASSVGSIIALILPYLYVIAGLLLLFYLIYGGFHMMTAANDEKGLVEAKGKITNALIGFLILFLAYWIVQIMEYILGIQIF